MISVASGGFSDHTTFLDVAACWVHCCLYDKALTGRGADVAPCCVPFCLYVQVLRVEGSLAYSVCQSATHY